MVPKFGRKFEDVSKLFDHAAHNGPSCLNGRCFVSLMLRVPVWRGRRVSCLEVPLGYRLWNKKESKLSLAADMVRKVMPVLQSERNVVILCDSRYAKKDVVVLLGEFPSLDVICNARTESVIYDLALEKTGKKVGDYYTASRRILTNLFGSREVLA